MKIYMGVQVKKKIKSEDDVKKKIVVPWLKELHAWQFMPVQRGLGVHGIPDHVAGVPVTITPQMVGQTVAILVAPEAKAPDKKHNASKLQLNQMEKIDEVGGITGVISCEWDKDLMHRRLLELVGEDQWS